jgi:hypothetical protein
MHWGACGRVGNAFPRPPVAKKNLPKFRLRRGVSWKSRRYEEAYRGSLLFAGSHMISMKICSSAPHGGPPPRPPGFNWTLFRLAIRSSTALASHETVLGSAVPSPATPPAPCCFQIIRSGLQQVRFLRKLMPGEGFYMNVLWCIIKAWKRCAVPAAIASCCHESICAFVASRPALTRY